MSGLPVLSALAKYDDLMRCQKELSSGIAEESEYLTKLRKMPFQITKCFICFVV